MTPAEKLPPTVRIGGFDFKIVLWDQHEAAAVRRYGEFSSAEMVIRITRNFSAPEKVVDTFLHEALHGIFWVYGIEDDDKEERTVGHLSTALMTLHRNNPWLADWISETLAS